MLASVGGAAEAAIVLAGGADIVDLRDPAALAPLPPAALRAAAAAVTRRRPLGAVTVSALAAPHAAMVREAAACGVDVIRVGLAPGAAAAGRFAELAAAAGSARLIAVLAAGAGDLSLLPAVLADLAAAGFAGAMLDVEDKRRWGDSAGRLVDRLGLPALAAFVAACHAAGLTATLAGGLEIADIPRLLVLAPDALGFSRALRDPAAVPDAPDPTRIRAVRALIPPQDGARLPPGRCDPDASEVDYRLLARGTPIAARDEPPFDRLLVDDLVLPASVGAYAREIGAPQRVRFAVQASLLRAGRSAEDMRDVLSYDLITDGIRLLVASGHFALVETLAERIAAMVLAHARVIRVVVRVQKLETGSGIVGIEIERSRAAGRGALRPGAMPPGAALREREQGGAG
jgi:dihydroneopterin aldolase